MESIVGTPTACDPLAQMRARAQEVLEGWLERLAPFFDQPQQPDLPTLSDFFTQHRGELLGGLLKALLELLYQPLFEQRAQTCRGALRGCRASARPPRRAPPCKERSTSSAPISTAVTAVKGFIPWMICCAWHPLITSTTCRDRPFG